MDLKRHLIISACVMFLCPYHGNSQTTVAPSEDTQACITEFLQWCQNSSFSSNSGVSVISSSNFNNGQGTRIYCRVDPEGAMCMENDSPWFHCFPDHTLQYKGNLLTETSTVDSDVCSAKNQAIKFQSRYQFNSTAFNESFQKKMDQFHNSMDDFKRRMQQMTNRLPFRIPMFPWLFWGDTPDDKETNSDSLESEYD